VNIPTPSPATRIYYIAIIILIAVALLASGAEIGYHEANGSASRLALANNTRTFCEIIRTEAYTTTQSLKQEVAFATAITDAAPTASAHATALSAERTISAVAANPAAAALVTANSTSTSNQLVNAYHSAAGNLEKLYTSVCG
jgi:hypothetical protein